MEVSGQFERTGALLPNIVALRCPTCSLSLHVTIHADKRVDIKPDKKDMRLFDVLDDLFKEKA